ncbi:hypothetical protein [Oceanobacter antarcticus]|uniref:Uncharacterized protein n=1 Tax=Oceanobacter antarcticus TaxID=3133425 RepID=A0ABW8NL32_9GAMM
MLKLIAAIAASAQNSCSECNKATDVPKIKTLIFQKVNINTSKIRRQQTGALPLRRQAEAKGGNGAKAYRKHRSWVKQSSSESQAGTKKPLPEGSGF